MNDWGLGSVHMSKYYPRKGKISKHFRDARNLYNNYIDYKIIKNKYIILLRRFTVSWTGSFRHFTGMVVPLSLIPMLFPHKIHVLY